MAEMVDMKLPKPEPEKSTGCCAIKSPCESDRWPYGLQLRFETEEVKKLPVLKEFKVGDKVMVLAEAVITEVRSTETQTSNGKTDTRDTVELQIHKVSVTSKIDKAVKDMSPKEYKRMREGK